MGVWIPWSHKFQEWIPVHSFLYPHCPSFPQLRQAVKCDLLCQCETTPQWVGP